MSLSQEQKKDGAASWAARRRPRAYHRFALKHGPEYRKEEEEEEGGGGGGGRRGGGDDTLNAAAMGSRGVEMMYQFAIDLLGRSSARGALFSSHLDLYRREAILTPEWKLGAFMTAALIADFVLVLTSCVWALWKYDILWHQVSAVEKTFFTL